MEIIKKEFVGEGGTHFVYRCEVIGKNYLIPLVLKIFKNPLSSNADNEIQSYQAMRDLGMPTLTLLEQVQFKGGPALIGQYLNSGDWIFVSPNHVITDTDRRLDEMYPGKLSKQFKVVAEQELYDNKLEGIENLKEFIKTLLTEIKAASEAKYHLNFDSYFFGVIKNRKNSPLRYVVGDFGDINHCPDWTTDELYENNVSQIKDALLAFGMHFIVEKNRKEYEGQIKAFCLI